jgi:hypothetical protein
MASWIVIAWAMLQQRMYDNIDMKILIILPKLTYPLSAYTT